MLNTELIVNALKKGLILIKRPVLIPEVCIYLLAGGLDFVLYSLSSVVEDGERLRFIESRMLKFFMR